MDNIEKINRVIESFFSSLGYQSKLEFKEEQADDGILINVKVDEPGMLIGKNGQNLSDIQHLLRLLVNKNLNEFTYLTIDINDYKYNQISEAEEEAKKAIESVLETEEAVVLEPMNPFMRKIIHLAVKKEPKLTSRSIGDEPNRRIMIEIR